MDEVVKVLRREAEVTAEPRERVPILARLGALLEDELELIDEAIVAFEEAVTLMPGYVPARQALGRLYRRTERWVELAELFRREAETEQDPAAKVSQLFKLAELRAHPLNDLDGAIAALQELLHIKPEYQPAWSELEALYTARGAWADLLRLYEEQLTYATDPDQQLFLLARIGQVSEEKAGDIDVAIAAYERMLAIRPQHLVAIRNLVRLAERQQRYSDMLEYLDAEIRIDPRYTRQLVELNYRAGVVLQNYLGQIEDAMARYEEVLTLDPSYLPALAQRRRALYAIDRQRAKRFSSMYRREFEATEIPANARSTLLVQNGRRGLSTSSNDEPKAIELLQEVLFRKIAANLPALRALGELHSAAAVRTSCLVEILRREADSLTNPAERAATLLRVAELCEERLDRADQAAEVYQEVLRLGHEFDAAIRGLVRIYSAAGLWNALSRALKTAYDHARKTISVEGGDFGAQCRGRWRQARQPR